MSRFNPGNPDRALALNPNFPPGYLPPSDAAEAELQGESQAWDLLTDRQRERIEADFIDRHFDRDLLTDIQDAGTDAKRIALIRRIQGLWLTHRAVELNVDQEAPMPST